MDQIIAQDKLIIRLDDEKITREFIDELSENKVAILDYKEILRTEHPHCAFFKNTSPSEAERPQRTVLYTPEGKLYKDSSDNNQDEAQIEDKYVKKENQLEILLFFLRDIEIVEKPVEIINEPQALIMPKSPLLELKGWLSDDMFENTKKEHEMNIVHVLSQLGKIYNRQIEILKDKMPDSIKYLVFQNVEDDFAENTILDKWHHYFIRKARLFKQ